MSATVAAALTFAQLVKLEPRLADLERQAKILAAQEGRKRMRCCGTRVWYDEIDPRLSPLVGWHRRAAHPVLCTSEAYDVASDHLYGLLPNCRQCGCI